MSKPILLSFKDGDGPKVLINIGMTTDIMEGTDGTVIFSSTAGSTTIRTSMEKVNTAIWNAGVVVMDISNIAES